MAKDTLLVLDSADTVVADGNTTPIDCEGGFFALVRLYMGAMSGGSTTFDCRVQVSTDNGSNYYMMGKFQTLGPTNDNLETAVPVYVPPAETAGQNVKVRLNYDVGGGAPSYVVTNAFLEPMTSLAPPAGDLLGSLGVVTRVAST